MSPLVNKERDSQNRIVKLFVDELGYKNYGHWEGRENNSNIEEQYLRPFLAKNYSEEQISAAIHRLKTEAHDTTRSLYQSNQAVYQLLRYGVGVKLDASRDEETVKLIDWDYPENNKFGVAEEVTLKGTNERRPDVVLYVNGIALGVIELKSARAQLSEAIAQLRSNQQSQFNQWFFSTAQYLFAANDSQGLKYGTIETEEKFYLRWKEDVEDDSRYECDKYFLKMCEKSRFLELIRDFVLFDGGIKKVPRHHQYFAIKAAQEHVKQMKGGIIWHTQGSGKSIVMVLLAKWIKRYNSEARIVVVTDRDALDDQIETVFNEIGESITRAKSGQDLVKLLKKPDELLICTLIHKFGKKSENDTKTYMEQLKKNPPKVAGEVFAFVDECHRTQSGIMHDLMQLIMPNAVYVGFTGTPLHKEDKPTTEKRFGGYIHKYKFNEAVADKVVLDLVVESRYIEQFISSEEKLDQWFEAKTKKLQNDWQRAALREHWGKKRKLWSSRSRMEMIVSDIELDFAQIDRLSNGGNAMLVASSIYEACRYFELFNESSLQGRCGIVTSYNPHAGDVSKEDFNECSETEKAFIYDTYKDLLEAQNLKRKKNETLSEAYEREVKRKFKKEPGKMKLLVVVDKLLTGFDAPSCSYLYIDKKMQDHGLFQAICRTNRLDGPAKDFGYIIDYMDLFKKVGQAIAVYSKEIDKPDGDEEVELQSRLEIGRERLEGALEQLDALCEKVEPPKDNLDYQRYFCGNAEIPEDVNRTQTQRYQYYKFSASMIRAWTMICDDLPGAGYSTEEGRGIEQRVHEYSKLRDDIRLRAGEDIDLKAYESDMRRLIDKYVKSEESERTKPFGDKSMIDVVVKSGIIEALKLLPDRIGSSRTGVAETVVNNVRRAIIKRHLLDPAYYQNMSKLLNEVIKDLKAERIEYEKFLKQIEDIINRLDPVSVDGQPEGLKSPAARALYNNLKGSELADETASVASEDVRPYGGQDLAALAIKLHETIQEVRLADWRGNSAKENNIKRALLPLLDNDKDEVNRLFEIVKQQKEY